MDSIKEDRLKKVLVSAYLKKEKDTVGDGWRKKVMADVRRIGPLNGNDNFFMLFDRFVWRFVPAACVLIAILTVYLFNSGFISEYDMSMLFINDPIDFAVVQLFDLM